MVTSHRVLGSPLAESTTCSCESPLPPAGIPVWVQMRKGIWSEELVWRVKTHGRAALPASICCTGGWAILRMFTTEVAAATGDNRVHLKRLKHTFFIFSCSANPLKQEFNGYFFSSFEFPCWAKISPTFRIMPEQNWLGITNLRQCGLRQHVRASLPRMQQEEELLRARWTKEWS